MLRARYCHVLRTRSAKPRPRITIYWLRHFPPISMILVTFLIVLLVLPQVFTQNSNEASSPINEPTPALRLKEEYLTKMILLNNENAIGDHLHSGIVNVRPEVGLLKTTARTFIQEGVTTEYTTQVLGTTLDNGRIYTQLLKKSFRILYEPSVVTSWIGEALQTRSILQNHNDVHNAEQPDWQAIDDRLLLKKNYLKDYTENMEVNELKKFNSKDQESVKIVSNHKLTSLPSLFLDSSSLISKNKIDKHFEEDQIKQYVRNISATKNLAVRYLPTYTVKNHFAPSGFSWKSGNGSFLLRNQKSAEQDTEDHKRWPKIYNHHLMKSGLQLSAVNVMEAVRPEVKSFEHNQVRSTVTYYGFAEFTTLVGDSVIVFSPSTLMLNATWRNVTSIKGDATLPRIYESVVNVSNTILHEVILPSQAENKVLVYPSNTHQATLDRADKDNFRFGTQNFQRKSSGTGNNNGQYTADTLAFGTSIMQLENGSRKSYTSLETLEKAGKNDMVTDITSQRKKQEVSLGSINQSVSQSKPTSEEIRHNSASLFSRDIAYPNITDITNQDTYPKGTKIEVVSTDPINNISNEKKKDHMQVSDVKVLGGATTIFFEDDLFSNLIKLTNSVDQVRTDKNETKIESTSVTKIPILFASILTLASSSITTERAMSTNSDKDLSRITDFEIKEGYKIEGTIKTPVMIVKHSTKTKAEDETKTTATPNSSSLTAISAIKNELEPNERTNFTDCIWKSEVIFLQLPKTLAYYTTFLFADVSTAKIKTTSTNTFLIPTFDISQATTHYCIQPMNVLDSEESTKTIQLQKSAMKHDLYSNEVEIAIRNTSSQSRTLSITPSTIVSQNHKARENLLESLNSLAESNVKRNKNATASHEEEYEDNASEEDEEVDYDDENDQEDDSEEDIDMIYKTLYTTYTYLTTFFHDSATSISSHREVITNVITSTNQLYLSIEPTKLLDNGNKISLQTEFVVPTELSTMLNLQEDGYIDELLPAQDNSYEDYATSSLDKIRLKKTLLTTYTYYTTLYTAGETEIITRKEVFTNYAADTFKKNSTKSIINQNTAERSTNHININKLLYVKPSNTSNTKQNDYITHNSNIKESFSLLIPHLVNYPITLVSDVRSNSYNGNHQTIENGLEYQISSESNSDEIIPSPTLLLQTIFTTFTFFTTMYSGKHTNVGSRLETVTNLVTETLQPTAKVEDDALPITYFTTFTYWTKLSKDGEIRTISREETISQVVPHTSVLYTLSQSERKQQIVSETNDVKFHANRPNHSTFHADYLDSSSFFASEYMDKLILSSLEPTTYYTTYTFYTTSYANDQTFTDSRFETFTNIVLPKITASLETTALLNSNTETNGEGKVSETITYPQLSIISYDNKQIVDADSISTFYFTTRVIASINEESIVNKITSSGSSLYIDETKKAFLPNSFAIEKKSEGNSIRQYKTGLVRLIQGTRIVNLTTTLYQSRVIGTVIDNRYAQIIESTSRILIAKTKSPQQSYQSNLHAAITETQTLQQTDLHYLKNINALPESVEGNISEITANIKEESFKETGEGTEDGEIGNSETPTRFVVQSIKRTFTPVIRPFLSRNRPQFAPKKKYVSGSNATIITRSELTPTITATPALKANARFNISRRSGISLTSDISLSFQNGSKRFSRVNKSSISSNQQYLAGSEGPFASLSVSFGSKRNRLTLSRNSQSSTFKRNSSFRGPTSSRAIYPGDFNTHSGKSRLRFKATSTLSLSQQTSYIVPFFGGGEQSATQENFSEVEDEETTSEYSRRNLNPLLRLRRPFISRTSSFILSSPQRTISHHRSSLSTRTKQITTTTTTTTASKSRSRGFQRPAVATFQSWKSRPQNNIFPPRRIFQGQQQTTQDIIHNTNVITNNDDDFNDGVDSDYYSEYEDEEDEEEEEETEDGSIRRKRSHKDRKFTNESSYKVKESQYKQELTTTRLNRNKRDAEKSQLMRNHFRNRYRRPKPTAGVQYKNSAYETESETSPASLSSRLHIGISSRFNSRQNFIQSSSTTTGISISNNHRAIRPTRTSTGRAQFTLREKDSTPTIRRGVARSNKTRRLHVASLSHRALTPPEHSRRVKSYINTNTGTETSFRSSAARSRYSTTTNRTKGSTIKGRSRVEINPPVPVSYGTITVTHFKPAEVTIPVINGKITEYKNVVTVKTSAEVLSPHQYTTALGSNQQPTTTLLRKETSINFSGATEITQFVLHEVLTTTVTFTPTTIRGRKTSFSQVIPSTAYSVENFISTSQPELAANAPLANILLSQLLLGNIALPSNPLIGALGAAITKTTQLVVTPTPVTEYRIHSSTYITTLYEGMPTVIPVTFQGKKILTTIFDTTAETITATEFITDTIVTTPTQHITPPAHTLLLQQLLLQHQQQHLQQMQQPQLPILIGETPSPLQLVRNLPELGTNNIRISNEDERLQDLHIVDETQTHKNARKKNRKSVKSNKRLKQQFDQKPSVITLYVSGRRPGEFSTILSTIPIELNSKEQKRYANVQRTNSFDSPEDFYVFDGSEMYTEYAMANIPLGDLIQERNQLIKKKKVSYIDRNILDLNSESNQNTQSLQSIIGDIGSWYAKTSNYEDQLVVKTITKTPTIVIEAEQNISKDFGCN